MTSSQKQKGLSWKISTYESVNEASDTTKFLRKLGWAGEDWTPKEYAAQIKKLPNSTLIAWAKSNKGIGKGIPNTPLAFQQKLVKIEMDKRGLSINEAKDYEVYHKSYTQAIQTAKEYALKRGYMVDDDDSFRKIGMGPKKPSEGKTNRFSISLTKNGKPQRKHLHIQVYNMGTFKRDNKSSSLVRSMHGGQNQYELNCYIS